MKASKHRTRQTGGVQVTETRIFVRQRRDVGQGAGRPRFAIVAVQGSDLKVFQSHVRRAELEAIAEQIGAQVVYLPRGGGDGPESKDGGQGGRRRRRKKE